MTFDGYAYHETVITDTTGWKTFIGVFGGLPR